ncbi:hypothetical protein K502DRAFT_348251 [Neoconidiobolus thromboides FSU 785]|nr:hypothetical protein K502DRAFT_348251 [Neoconidiobolus thromboides FSU 785]
MKIKNKNIIKDKLIDSILLKDRKVFIRIYLTLIFVRFLLSYSFGYIHPDEFFQSGEILARDILDIDTLVTWEFNPSFPCRSIVFPYIFGAPPFYAFKFLIKYYPSFNSTLFLYIFQRTYSTILSLLIDFSLYKLIEDKLTVKRGLLLLWSTSYLVTSYFTHSFSNSAETIILGICLLSGKFSYNYSIKGFDERIGLKNKRLLTRFILGLFVSIGVMTRVTFIFFLLPLSFYCIYCSFKGIMFVKKRYRLWLWLFRESFFIISFIASLYLFVFIDSVYFRNDLKLSDGLYPSKIKDKLIFTFLNNIRYNMNSDNLAIHGIHPRYLNLIVNMPLLFLPCIIAIIVDYKAMMTNYISKLMLSTIISGTTFLSFIPHQEPRFLIPLSIPYFVLSKSLLKFHEKKFLNLWLFYNMLLVMFYCGLHQAGVIPTLIRLNKDPDINLNCINLHNGFDTFNTIKCNVDTIGNGRGLCDSYVTFVFMYKSFMGPRHLLYSTNNDQKHTIILKDLIGIDDNEFHKFIENYPSPIIQTHDGLDSIYWERKKDEITKSITCSRTLVVTTSSHIQSWSSKALLSELKYHNSFNYNMSIILKQFPHINTDEIGVIIQHYLIKSKPLSPLVLYTTQLIKVIKN